MRELGFSEHWPKLNAGLLFTTFRYPRRHRDWQVEEVVRVVYRPRSPKRDVLGVARIIRKEVKDTSKEFTYYGSNTPVVIRPEEAEEDGFTGMHGGGSIEKMKKWLRETYGYRFYSEPVMHKLTLYWMEIP